MSWVTVILLSVAIIFYGPGVLIFKPNISKVEAGTESKYASSHITGSFATPDNALGAANGSWAGELNKSSSYTSRWAMEDPSGGITGTQTIDVWSRKGSNSGTPTIALNLYENGSLVQSIVGNTNVTSTTGMNISGTFDASVITSANDVEIEAVETGVGGSPSARNSAQIDSIAWTVNLLDTVVTVGTSGSHVSSLSIPTTDGYVGGAFTFIRNTGSANVTSIKISGTGTVDEQANLSNVKLVYKQEASCSSSVPGGTSVFNSTPGTFDASSDTTVTGTMAVGASQICVYVTLDVGSGASNGQTIKLQITDPSTEVAISAGTVSPTSAVVISSQVTLSTGPSTDQLLRHGNWFNSGSEQGFYWAD